MAAGRKTGGRVKGTPNKVTALAKDTIAQAAHEMGGVDGLVNWIKKDEQNERAFWSTMYTKLIPVQHEGNNGGPIQLIATWQPPE